MHLKKLIKKTENFLGTLPFFQDKHGKSGSTFLGAYCHQGKFIFLKSTQKGTFFVTQHELF
jgi:hypothetical protein